MNPPRQGKGYNEPKVLMKNQMEVTAEQKKLKAYGGLRFS